METNLTVHTSPKNPDLEFGLSNLEFGNGVLKCQILVHNGQTLICGAGDGIILYIGGALKILAIGFVIPMYFQIWKNEKNSPGHFIPPSGAVFPFCPDQGRFPCFPIGSCWPSGSAGLAEQSGGIP